jgi:hypothetical protein
MYLLNKNIYRHGANNPKYRKLHQEQAYIGRAQLFQGRLVSEWSKLQEEFLEENAAAMEVDQRHYTGVIWARKLVNILWTIVRAQWDSRNADRHGRIPEESQSIRRDRLAQQVSTQYQLAPLMQATDRTLVEEPIENKMRKSLGSIALWLQHTRPTIRLSTDAATQAISRTHTRITKYFNPTKPSVHKTNNEKDCEDTAAA